MPQQRKRRKIDIFCAPADFATMQAVPQQEEQKHEEPTQQVDEEGFRDINQQVMLSRRKKKQGVEM